MNTCVSCHSQGRGGSFQLVRVAEGNSRAAAQTNLTAALEFVNVDKAAISPLLVKSVVAHGGAAAAPLKGRQSAPFQTMQSWVDETLAGNPHIREMRQAEMPFGQTTAAKKEYGGDPFASSERPAALPPLQTQPLTLPPAPRMMPQSHPIGQAPRELGLDTKKIGDVTGRPTPRLDDVKTPAQPAVVGPVTPPSVPRDPFDPTEFNSRPK